MRARRLGRFARLPAQACIALALFGDGPQQLELSIRTSDRLVPRAGHIAPAETRPPVCDPGLATRAATRMVAGVAWLAAVSLPLAEPYPEP